jgi:hypothetical protein
VAPKGETIISCGECHHPRFYVLLHEETQQPARWACAHCGNEIKLLRATHEGGHA